ncbi:MAG: GrpB family protein [Ilumatobacteraceae bacterium]|nr:GrpB family protein [Ilumatobacteraceae bacterium]
MTNPIVVVDYDPQWPAAFSTIRVTLETALASVPVLGIEHVGSTSVPGLAAKPVIDIDVIVDRSHVGDAAAALESFGYAPLGDMGVPDRYAFKAPSDAIRQNTYVIVDGCLSLRNHLGLRDVLRGDTELRDEYSSVKRRLAAATDDIDVYVDGKIDVVRRVLARAGLADGELYEIEAGNRL